MDGVITIKTERGRMDIRLEQFFPTTQKRCKQLKKIISEDWENENSLMAAVQMYLDDQIRICLTFGTADISKSDKLKKNKMWVIV